MNLFRTVSRLLSPLIRRYSFIVKKKNKVFQEKMNNAERRNGGFYYV